MINTSSNDLNEIKQVTHFYYCLLVAIKIERKGKRCVHEEYFVNYVHKWLLDAEKKKLFPRYIKNELDWLTKELKGVKSIHNYEMFVNRVYLLCLQTVNQTIRDSECLPRASYQS